MHARMHAVKHNNSAISLNAHFTSLMHIVDGFEHDYEPLEPRTRTNCQSHDAGPTIGTAEAWFARALALGDVVGWWNPEATEPEDIPCKHKMLFGWV